MLRQNIQLLNSRHSAVGKECTVVETEEIAHKRRVVLSNEYHATVVPQTLVKRSAKSIRIDAERGRKFRCQPEHAVSVVGLCFSYDHIPEAELVNTGNGSV